MSHSNDPHYNRHAPVHDGVVELIPPGSAFAHSHHQHTIVPLRILVAVLCTLLFFTLATVFAAKAEEWFAGTFNVIIPAWINVVVALSIGVVKSALVFAYFMQLRYDNPTNSLILAFTFIVFMFFIGFIMIDLGNRDTIDHIKSEHKILGGTGLGTDAGKSKAALAREQSMARIQRWAQKSGDVRAARLELVTAMQVEFQKLRDEAKNKIAEVGDEGNAVIGDGLKVIGEALDPFVEGAGKAPPTDEDIRVLERAIGSESGRMERAASAIGTTVGAFEMSAKTAVMNYRIVTRPPEPRDVHFIAGEIERMRAAKTPLPEWLEKFEHEHLHALEAGLPATGHGHFEPWNDPGEGSSPTKSRPRTGITLPELGGGEAHGEGHGEPAAGGHEAPKPH